MSADQGSPKEEMSIEMQERRKPEASSVEELPEFKLPSEVTRFMETSESVTVYSFHDAGDNISALEDTEEQETATIKIPKREAISEPSYDPQPGPSNEPQSSLPRSVSSSQPDSLQEETDEDQVKKACEELMKVTEHISSSADTFVNTFQCVSSFHPDRVTVNRAMRSNPLLLTSICSQIPNYLQDLKRTATSIKYSSAVFKESRQQLANSCKEIVRMCTDLKQHLEEIKAGLPLDRRNNRGIAELSKNIDLSLKALSSIIETLPPKIQELENIVIKPGKITEEERALLERPRPRAPSPEPPNSGRKLRMMIFVYVVITLVFILLIVFIISIQTEIDTLKKQIGDKANRPT